MQNYVEQHAIFGHTWSLVIIEHFYIAMPIIVWGLSKITTNLKERIWLLVLFGAVVASIALYARYSYIESNTALISWPILSSIPYWTTTYHLDAIVVGCLLALFFKFQGQQPINRWLIYGLWAFGVTAYAILFFGIDWSYYWGDWYLYSIGYFAFASLMVAALKGVSTLSRLKWLQWVGRHSYGIYIWHYLILMFWKQYVGVWPITLITIGYLMTAILAGFISTNTIEKFFLGLRKKKSILA